MPVISPEFIERYQIEYQKNPKSRIFAPLAEAYRQMGMLSEALHVCSKGVQIHPEFAGGLVALAKIRIDRKEPEEALTQLKKAAQISPDNLLAHMLMGETLIELRRPKDALEAFKMVLFLNPTDQRALKAVRKWEFLSADDYQDDLFEMRPIFDGPPLDFTSPKASGAPAKAPLDPAWRAREIERAVSLADAFTVRGDLEKAMQTLKDANLKLGAAAEIDKRLANLDRKIQVFGSDATADDQAAGSDARERKRSKLQSLLRRISERRSGG
jgi:tetratricopeptide (TPR) repeat protein